MARSNRYKKYFITGADADGDLDQFDWFVNPIGFMHPSSSANTPLTDTAVIQATDLFFRDVRCKSTLSEGQGNSYWGGSHWMEVMAFVDSEFIQLMTKPALKTAFETNLGSFASVQEWLEGEPVQMQIGSAAATQGTVTVVKHKVMSSERYGVSGSSGSTFSRVCNIETHMRNVTLKEGRGLVCGITRLNESRGSGNQQTFHNYVIEANYQRRPRHRR